jgi:hypothetical protein
MNPATTDDQELFSRMVALAPFGAGMAPDVKPYATDAVPPINARGGRGGEGWRAVYSATVMKGACVHGCGRCGSGSGR